ncbi:MAG: 50S ribosomal protein L14e [Candidatus ainarchaeum sp.]|jgi:ribosomal protein L14E/L6E/L27E|nr:50S ribosomal protein L14e [Candidatus ainarchaeum sp.]MDD3085749.1 50S ribosomal protein L14e [Candidatus ainarchaeum sp.]MDD4128482.1 50S ribosomal protein L14e [Candidatus ainarchaeum sp.]MDD4467885.1 50S ribosomal protein L14e [Candidatus ainarchaeum sp.]HPM85537.1 50S ribosomal protein L14e [archaeon]
MEIGDVAIKTKGREAGRRVTIKSNPKNGKVLVEGKNVKAKECNILHLFLVDKGKKK